MTSLASIIIPTKKINNYIRQEIIPALIEQTFKNFELIIVPDKSDKKEKFPFFVKVVPSGPKKGPANKRDLGVKKAKGKIIAFIDDDAYPDKNWLKNAIKYFQNNKIAAVCGPGVTPETDNLWQKASGWVWTSWLGAGAAGTYRCHPEKKREVDDYPTFNLIVRKKDFQKVGGFDSHFWPGEDTKLCHDLVYKLKKKIIYDPKILVYHHRRPVFLPHLKQISRFGLHRGHFAKILPQTSKRIGYFIPLFFVIGLLGGPLLIQILKSFNLEIEARLILTLYLWLLLLYSGLLVTTGFWIGLKSKKWLIGFLVIPAIFLSHLVYGIMFAQGLLLSKLKQ